MLITVTTDSTFEAHGTVSTVTGTDENGEEVTFAGDQRMIVGLFEATLEEGEILAEVEDYQILRRG